jgi:hypothetical protein
MTVADDPVGVRESRGLDHLDCRAAGPSVFGTWRSLRFVSHARRVARPWRRRQNCETDVADRVAELLFGLFMALTFVGAVSVAEAGREEIRAMFVAALGCNLA